MIAVFCRNLLIWNHAHSGCMSFALASDELDPIQEILKALATLVVMSVVFLVGWDKAKSRKGNSNDGTALRRPSRGPLVLGVMMMCGGVALLWAGAEALGWMGAGVGLLLAGRELARRVAGQRGVKL